MSKPSIHIDVNTEYLPEQSNPSKQQYSFAYHITLTNRGNLETQLISRHWVITDGNNVTREVSGLGVVGQQPFIAAGDNYRYTSGAVLETVVGVMRGSYHMQTKCGFNFNVEIPEFRLAIPNAVH